MPAGILPDEGLDLTLSELLGKAAIPLIPWKLVLWTNDIVPTSTTVFADLIEATFSGYSRANLDRADWVVPLAVAGCCHATFGASPIAYTVSGGPFETILGCAYFDSLNGVLRFVQRYDPGDIKTVELGSIYKVPPTFTLTSAAC